MALNDLIVIDGLQYCKWDREYFHFLHQSKITAVHITLVYHENTRETLARFGEWNTLFNQNADLIMPIICASDIDKAKELGKVGIFFGAQNCSPIEDDISLVEIMRKLGLFIMQLTYNNQSLLATGCYEDKDSGLTRFGKQVVDEMNRVGMIIDMSHSSEQSTLETIEYSSRAICISHANPSFAHKAKRNKSNAVLKSLAHTKGLLGLSLYPFHLPNTSHCTLDTFCQMAADTVEVMGIDCVGVGSDLCLRQPQSILEWMRNGRWSKKMDFGEGSSSNANWPENPSWFSDSEGMENIHNGLLKQGFSAEEREKILGKNWSNFLASSLQPHKSNLSKEATN